MDLGQTRTPWWDSRAVRTYTHPDELRVRDRLADAAKAGDWMTVFAVLDEHPEWVNSPRPGSSKRYAPLHQAAWHNAPVDIVERLLRLGAWRTLRNGAGHMPFIVAAIHDHDDLAEFLRPEIRNPLSYEVIADLQASLYDLIARYDRMASKRLNLPEIKVLTELEQPRYSIRLNGGSFLIELRGDHLAVAALDKGYSAAVYRIDLDGIHQQ